MLRLVFSPVVHFFKAVRSVSLAVYFCLALVDSNKQCTFAEKNRQKNPFELNIHKKQAGQPYFR